MTLTVLVFAVAMFGPIVLVSLIIAVVQAYEAIVEWVRSRREERIADLEEQLDRQQAQLRATILSLAEQLNADAHEARKALIRESFLARGEIPKN